MQCPHCAHPDSIRYGTSRVSNATVAKPANGSFKQYDEAKIQPSSNRPALSRRDGDASDRQGSRHPSQDGLSLVGPSCPVTPSKPTTDRSLLLHRNR